MLADVELMSRATIFIGTISSNVFRFTVGLRGNLSNVYSLDLPRDNLNRRRTQVTGMADNVYMAREMYSSDK